MQTAPWHRQHEAGTLISRLNYVLQVNVPPTLFTSTEICRCPKDLPSQKHNLTSKCSARLTWVLPIVPEGSKSTTPKMSQTQLAAKLKSDRCILAQVTWYSRGPDAEVSYDRLIVGVFIEEQSRGNYCEFLCPTRGPPLWGPVDDAAASSVNKLNNAVVRMNLSFPTEKSIKYRGGIVDHTSEAWNANWQENLI